MCKSKLRRERGSNNRAPLVGAGLRGFGTLLLAALGACSNGDDKVAAPQVPTTPALTFTTSAAPVATGATVTLNWTATDVTSCSASGSWSGAKAASGSEQVVPAAPSSTYTLQCSGAGGSITRDTVVSVLAAPTLVFAADSTSVAAGAAVNLTWTATDSSGCSASGGWAGSKATAGTESSGPIASTTEFILACTGAGGTAAATVTVSTVAAGPPVVGVGHREVLEPSGGDGTATFVIGLDRTAAADVTVTYETRDQSATAGADYRASAGQAVIAAGSLSVEVGVPILADGVPEGHESFFFALIAVSGADAILGGQDLAIGTVLEDAAPPPTGANLTNGGSVSGPDGLELLALDASLVRAVSATITSTAAPPEPLPDLTTAIGPFYEIRADRDVFTRPGAPLMLSLPAPAGLDVSNLWLGVRTPTSAVRDSFQNGDFYWSLLPVRFDSARNRLEATLPFLAADGRVLVIASAPVTPTSTGAAAGIEKTSGRQAAQQTELPPGVGGNRGRVAFNDSQFVVTCKYFGNVDCGLGEEQAMARVLFRLEESFRARGYGDPALTPHLTGTQTLEGEPVADGWHAYIVPASSPLCAAGTVGFYLPETAELTLCYDKKGQGRIEFNADIIETLAHELFHAYQYSHTRTRENAAVQRTEGWVIEATATTASNSYDPALSVLQRDGGYAARQVAIPLQQEASPTDLFHYQSQDLWVFASRIGSIDALTRLQAAFALGSDTDAGRSVLASITGESFDTTYWLWVKNQVFEKFEDMTPPQVFVLNPCRLETRQLLPPAEVIEYLSDEGTKEGVLEPLQARIVRFEMQNKDVASFFMTETRSEYEDETLPTRYKIYPAEPPGNCRDRVDGQRSVDDVKTSGPFYYVILANPDPEISVPFRLVWD